MRRALITLLQALCCAFTCIAQPAPAINGVGRYISSPVPGAPEFCSRMLCDNQDRPADTGGFR